ncbi:MAG: lysophospholipid acyltransferase family protein [Candidatus Riflebacteria bacterium]
MSALKLLRQSVISFSKIAGSMPEEAGRHMAVAMGLLLFNFWHSERNRVIETLDRISFRTGRKFDQDLRTIVRKNFIHYALNIYEVMRIPKTSSAELERKMIFHGCENIENALAAGRGVIFALPHIGNWELFGAAIAHRGYPLHSFYMAQKEDEIGSLLDHFRKFYGIILHDRDRGWGQALRSLRQSQILGMIADQDGSNIGVYLDFLGHFVSIPAGPANWSLKTGARLMPIYSKRRGFSQIFDAWFLPALPEENAETHEQRVVARTKRLCEWMEELIFSCPHQYLWFYDRFKPRHESWLTAGKKRDGQIFHGEAWYG